ncbi:ABC transporter permease [Robertmurraya siralis]|uniref:ABC transporter permease n=1 Tax=Robertmurraya siralis TaxID=77777 RepID=UPI0010F9924F|nr:ABC transporter permease [Robertmurraya siralis]
MKITLSKKRKIMQLIFLLFIIFILLSCSMFSLNSANKTIQQDIYDFSRGDYDILLRPRNSQTPIEKKLGLVEENYLGVGDGGISIEQWESVKNREDVEVAAPVAAIGLYTASAINYSLPERGDSVRYTVKYSTTDGVNTYDLGETYTAYSFLDPNRFSDYSTITDDSLVNVFWGEYPSFLFPLTYHQVVAIDVEEEKKLTGEDYSKLEVSSSGLNPDFDEIPILGLKDANVPLKASIKIENIDLSEDDIRELKHKYKIDSDNGVGFEALSYRDKELHTQLMKEMAEKTSISTEIYELDFSKAISPFYDNYLYADKDYHLLNYEEHPTGEEMWGTIDSGSQKTYYSVGPVNYQFSGNEIFVKQIGKDEKSDIPLYRDIQKEINFVTEGPNVIEGEGLYFKHVGYFEVDQHEEELAASPLGIYGIHPTYLAKDKETLLQPTSLPGSFITTPAHGLISINWAERLKTDTPIDAIRVRVADISGYDKSAADKIKNMAAEFESEGFTVDIVAGASNQSLTINVEGIGEVIQPWTTLGAADTILKSWDISKIILVTFFMMVSLVYIIFSFSNLIKSRRNDELLLMSFGWKKEHIKRLRFNEWSLILGSPFMLAFIMMLVASFIMKETLLIISLVIVFIIVCLSMFLIEKVHKLNVKQEYSPARNGTITWKNTWYYRSHITFSMFQTCIMTIVSIFLTLVMVLQEKQTTQTTLGIYVHGQMEWFYSVLLIFLYSLTILTLIESLLSLWQQRSDEINTFHHIGWNKKQLYSFYLKEVALWSGISVFIGVLISVISYQILFGRIEDSLIWVGGIAVMLFTIILLVSLFVLSNVLHKSINLGYKKVR